MVICFCRCQAEAELNAPSHWELKQPRKKAHSVGPTMRHQSGEESEVCTSVVCVTVLFVRGLIIGFGDVDEW